MAQTIANYRLLFVQSATATFAGSDHGASPGAALGGITVAHRRTDDRAYRSTGRGGAGSSLANLHLLRIRLTLNAIFVVLGHVHPPGIDNGLLGASSSQQQRKHSGESFHDVLALERQAVRYIQTPGR